jgi:phosphoribosylamine--glycine ligase
VVPLLRSDLAEVMQACADGRLADVDPAWSDDAAVTVVMASRGYPDHSTDPVPIRGLDAAVALGCTVFHAGTTLGDGEVLATGGRVLAVTAVAPELGAARDLAHAGVAAIDFDGAQHRADIARTTAEVG